MKFAMLKLFSKNYSRSIHYPVIIKHTLMLVWAKWYSRTWWAVTTRILCTSKTKTSLPLYGFYILYLEEWSKVWMELLKCLRSCMSKIWKIMKLIEALSFLDDLIVLGITLKGHEKEKKCWKDFVKRVWNLPWRSTSTVSLCYLSGTHSLCFRSSHWPQEIGGHCDLAKTLKFR